MSSNAHTNGGLAAPHEGGVAMEPATTVVARDPAEIGRLIRELELPFEASSIEWRVTNTSHDKTRGQIPFRFSQS